MLATDETALVCDLAETYGIYDYRSYPATVIATFAVGLRENARIWLKMNKMAYPLETISFLCFYGRKQKMGQRTETAQK